MRYVDLGTIDTIDMQPFVLFYQTDRFQNPVMITIRYRDPGIVASDFRPYSEVINLGNVPAGTELVRVIHPRSQENYHLWFSHPDTLNLTVSLPREDFKDKNTAIKMYLAAVVHTIRSYDIKVERQRHNDVMIYVDGKWKKAVGQARYDSPDSWILGAAVTFEFDAQLAELVTGVDISDKVGGLWEADPTISVDEFRTRLTQRFGARLGVTLETDTLTSGEQSDMQTVGAIMNDPKWIMDGEIPDVLMPWL